MPNYAYRCPKCGTEEERYVPVAERNMQKCHSCHVVMEKLFMPGFSTIGEIEPYYDVGLGHRVESRKHRRQLMKELGVEEK
jgi:putative FmdB family regulatory protein